jgi:hypothetical protein
MRRQKSMENLQFPAIRDKYGQTHGRIARLLDEKQGSGQLVVSLDRLAAEARISRLAAERQLQRLGSRVALLPGQPRSYLIVPPEHRQRGAPPLTAWLHDYCRIRDISYYVGLLSAAALHGSSAQAAQISQVMTMRPQRRIGLGRLSIDFHVKRALKETPLTALPGLAAPLAVSSPEATALDLIEFNHAVGGMRRAVEVIAGMTPKMTAAGWRRALHEAVPVSVRQRLGYVLTLLNLESYATMAEKSLPSRLNPTVLQTRSPASKSRLKPSTPFYIFENVDIRSDR